MSDRKLPEPIKPRALQRRKNPIHGFDYFTSDGRYEVFPLYKDRPNGGTSNRVDMWVLKDLRDPEVPNRYYPLLDDIRRYHCAPDGKVPWLVYDVDEGMLRVEPTRQAAVAWASSLAEAFKVKERHQYGDGRYEYVFADSDGDVCGNYLIVRADAAHLSGIDPVQQPLYPFPDDPFEQVDRPAPKVEEAA